MASLTFVVRFRYSVFTGFLCSKKRFETTSAAR